MKIRSLNLWCF